VFPILVHHNYRTWNWLWNDFAADNEQQWQGASAVIPIILVTHMLAPALVHNYALAISKVSRSVLCLMNQAIAHQRARVNAVGSRSCVALMDLGHAGSSTVPHPTVVHATPAGATRDGAAVPGQ
jgi:hypothetical protein